ncbi:(2Fe-2S)-binding protein [Marivibrio halodurans]|uniref:(2Fe-2S)-binding protein n=1 Tax=Marivibrio halodurans TaxID=2039722 RepID=UPI0031BB3670
MNTPSKRTQISITVNGKTYSRDVEARRTLADFLREDLGLTGTHIGCEHGACGACTVTVDGMLARSCLTLASQMDGCEIRTVEGLSGPNGLHPIQAAFKEHHALQCGYCTPGFLVTAAAMLEETQDPTEGQVRDWLSGNICRCTGYQFIVDAVLSAAETMRSETEERDAS